MIFHRARRECHDAHNFKWLSLLPEYLHPLPWQKQWLPKIQRGVNFLTRICQVKLPSHSIFWPPITLSKVSGDINYIILKRLAYLFFSCKWLCCDNQYVGYSSIVWSEQECQIMFVGKTDLIYPQSVCNIYVYNYIS